MVLALHIKAVARWSPLYFKITTRKAAALHLNKRQTPITRKDQEPLAFSVTKKPIWFVQKVIIRLRNMHCIAS
jgi:hypothetical protein